LALSHPVTILDRAFGVSLAAIGLRAQCSDSLARRRVALIAAAVDNIAATAICVKPPCPRNGRALFGGDDREGYRLAKKEN
jgi:hypothetical protein